MYCSFRLQLTNGLNKLTSNCPVMRTCISRTFRPSILGIYYLCVSSSSRRSCQRILNALSDFSSNPKQTNLDGETQVVQKISWHLIKVRTFTTQSRRLSETERERKRERTQRTSPGTIEPMKSNQICSAKKKKKIEQQAKRQIK